MMNETIEAIEPKHGEPHYKTKQELRVEILLQIEALETEIESLKKSLPPPFHQLWKVWIQSPKLNQKLWAYAETEHEAREKITTRLQTAYPQAEEIKLGAVKAFDPFSAGVDAGDLFAVLPYNDAVQLKYDLDNYVRENRPDWSGHLPTLIHSLHKWSSRNHD